MSSDALKEEAAAFDQRIEERRKAGFIADLRRGVRCEYFYKSFWRDPHFIRLFVGRVVENYVEILRTHAARGASILDVGCGAGYMALELARAGYCVKGIDISPSCIETARETLATNPYKDGFGSLEYEVKSFQEITGEWDVLLFSGCLHHLPDAEQSVSQAIRHVRDGGLIICWEPCHEDWRIEDAAQVALIRGMLSIAGMWYEKPDTLGIADRSDLYRFIEDIHVEYVQERDKSEIGGQSPHDNESSGRDILLALRRQTQELEYRPMASFIYRLLGGLRGPDSVVHPMADFLAHYDSLGVEKGFLRPNTFIFAGRKSRSGG